MTGENYDINEYHQTVFPKTIALKPLPPEIPKEYADDFDEARKVVEISPQSSSALSRRILQHVIRSVYRIKKRDLYEEVREFIDTVKPPSSLADTLDAIRAVGNFAAHPIKNTATGQIEPVEPGEAEWLIELVEMLFDFAFVQPEREKQRKAALNAKLRAAGKPELP
jgi:hypothetical protein